MLCKEERELIIQCNRCAELYCMNCINMAKPTLLAINSCNNALWCCNGCVDEAKRVLISVEALEKRVEGVERGLATQMKKWELRFKTLEEKQGKRESREENDPTATVEKVETMVGECREREKRRNNMIVFNLEEGRDENEDVDRMKDILKSIKAVVPLVNLVRLGKKGDRSRPLRISTGSEEEKARVLRAAAKLRNTEFKKIYISSDLTPLERERRRKLVEEMKEKNQQAENKTYVIRGWHVVEWKDVSQSTPPQSSTKAHRLQSPANKTPGPPISNSESSPSHPAQSPHHPNRAASPTSRSKSPDTQPRQKRSDNASNSRSDGESESERRSERIRSKTSSN